MNTETQTRKINIGDAVYQSAYSKTGHVVAIRENDNTAFIIGSRGMEAAPYDVAIVWEDLTKSDLPGALALPWAENARRMGLASIDDAGALSAKAEAKAVEDRRAAQAEKEEAARIRAEFEEEAQAKIPFGAKAVIVAELVEDDSDVMTDYFGSITKRVVILGFSKHTRDLFPEMRKAARNFSETAHLADAPESAEHREKYSMGAGFYLKQGHRHTSGWQVSKRKFYGDTDPVKSLPTAEWSLGEPETAPEAGGAAVGGIRIEEHTHTKKGFQMFVCIMPERVDRAEFDRLRDLASNLGGWYSRPWGKTPGGFAFKDRESAETFANPVSDAPASSEGQAAARPGNARLAEKLRDMADRLQGDIAAKMGERRTNTPKQQREAAAARQEGRKLQRAQKAMRALADMHEAGNVPPELAGVTTKAAILDLASAEIDRCNAGYYDAGIDTGRPAKDTPEARALWALVGDDPEARAADELQRKLDELKFAKIPGYFPTPRPVVERMLELARIPDGEPCDILEPSAGSGAILDVVREQYPQAELVAYEINGRLREVLELKGYGAALAGGDFMAGDTALRFDVAIMNPPFERGQDVEHVARAHAFLKPGGRLVAIMSPGPFFRSDRKSQAFREWFEEAGGEKFELPDGSFKESGTGVGAVLVVIDREG